MRHNAFFDPATGVSYQWPRNNSKVEKAERSRALTELAPTAAGWQDGVRPALQQNLEAPEVLVLTGRVWDVDQVRVFSDFLRITKRRTVIFEEFSGERYEVLLDSLEPKRIPVVRAPNGGRYVWEFSLQMEIVNRI